MNSESETLQDLIQYPSHRKNRLKEFRALKSLERIVNTPAHIQEQQFEVLSEGNISKDAFYNDKKHLNRYSNIWAYQHTRVKLPQIGPDYYLNGNEVRSLVDGKIFAIFTQAPVNPFDNFWEAVYYKNVKLIAMLCIISDPKKGRQQAEMYWPKEEEQIFFSNQKLRVENVHKRVVSEEYVQTQFAIYGSQGKKTVKHLQWMGWPDFKKPVESKLQHMETIIAECMNSIAKSEMILIHCSAGIGRTGTLGGILEATRLYKERGEFSIFQIVENMRHYRYYSVQSEQQYKFLYSYLPKRLSKF